MSQSRLDYYSIFSIESDLSKTFNFDDLIEKFAAKKCNFYLT